MCSLRTVEANGNFATRSALRDWYRASLPSSGCPELHSDDSLKRLADARNLSSKSANRLMIISLCFSILYMLRSEGIGQTLSVAGYPLKDIPYGLYIFCICSLSLSIVSMIRSCDSRNFDRRLKFACDTKDIEKSKLIYLSFPNDEAWAEPFGQGIVSVKSNIIIAVIKYTTLALFSILTLVIFFLPTLIGISYIWTESYALGSEFLEIRKYSTLLLVVLSALSFTVLFWTRTVDCD